MTVSEHLSALRRPQRILHVVEAFGGGVYEMLRVLAARTAAEGLPVAIAYGRRPETPMLVRDDFPPGVQLFALPWEARTAGAQLAAAKELRRVVAVWRPDVIHLHSSFAGVLGATVLGGRVPTVFSPHAYASAMRDPGRVRRAAFRRIERFSSRRATLVGAVSVSEALFAAEELEAPRVRAVPNGVPELDDPPGRCETPGRPRVVALGRVCPQRQPEACARILSGLTDLADVAWVGGGDPESAGVAALATAGVSVTGWLPRERALTELERATVYLHWTAWDGMALSVLDALARDVVVVGHDIPPTRELLGSRQVRADERDALALIRRILVDEPFRAELLAEQRRRRATYAAERMVRDWLELYDDLRLPVDSALARS